MRRLISVTVALFLVSSTASAQTVTERLRVQGGLLTQAPPPPQVRTEDFFISGTPELSALWTGRMSTFTLTYQLTGALHSLGGASEIANRVILASVFDLSPRTTLILGGEASQSTFSQFLIQAPAASTALAVAPSPSTRLLSAHLSQGISHQLSPRWRLEQNSDAGATTVLRPSPPLDTYVFGLGGAVERLWPNDAVGVETRATYVRAIAEPPTPDQEYVTLTGGPRWRHDWSRTISSTAAGGVVAVISPRVSADLLIAPYARASALYTFDPASIDLSYSWTVMPSAVTAQLVRSQQVTLHGQTPLSQRAQVTLGASIGYLRGEILDLTPLNNNQKFDSVLSDVDLTWQATSHLNVFARYQFAAQFGETTATGVNPSFLRDVFIVGFVLASAPAGGPGVQTRFAQRVDGGDQPPRQ